MGNKNIFSGKKKYVSKLLNFKSILLIMLLIVILMAIYFYARPIENELSDTKDDSEDIVAYMGDKKITFDDIDRRVKEIIFFDKNKIVKNVGEDMYKKEIAKYIVYEELLYKKAESENIVVTKEETEETYNKIKKFLIGQLNLSESEFNKKYAWSKQILMKNMRKSVKAYKYLENSSNVTNSDARNYYDSHKNEFEVGLYKDIFISSADDYKNNGNFKISEKKVKKIYDGLYNGEKFENLEKIYSDDVNINRCKKNFEIDLTDENVMNKISTLKVGEYLKEPIISPYGYHIVKRVGSEQEPFDKVKEEIKSMLTYKKQIKLMEDLQDEYDVRFTEKYK